MDTLAPARAAGAHDTQEQGVNANQERLMLDKTPTPM